MSNYLKVSENFCAIANLKNYFLTAYPNYLILGKPIKTLTSIEYESKTYMKIRSCDFEQWYVKFNCALEWFVKDTTSACNETILEECNFKYVLNGACVENSKVLKITLIVDNDTVTFEFDKQELKNLMLQFADLMMHVFCVQDNLLQIFQHSVNHYLSFSEWSDTKVSKIIANLGHSDVLKLCKTICKNKNVEGSLSFITDFILKQKLNVLIVYQIKRNCLVPVPELIKKYLE